MRVSPSWMYSLESGTWISPGAPVGRPARERAGQVEAQQDVGDDHRAAILLPHAERRFVRVLQMQAGEEADRTRHGGRERRNVVGDRGGKELEDAATLAHHLMGRPVVEIGLDELERRDQFGGRWEGRLAVFPWETRCA